MAPPLARGAGRARLVDHERRAHRDLGRAPRCARSTRATCEADWEAHILEPELWAKVAEIPDKELWAAHRSQKERLIRFARERVRTQSARHGKSPDELRELESLFDPRALTIGFARRFATYKRAVLVLSDLERLRRLVSNADRPVQLIFAGKAHPADRAGQDVIRKLFLLTQGEFRGKIVFLEDYDMEVGRMLVQGADVWLNTPRRPQEAAGTSGQKSPINGGVNLSILDGWWVEGYRGDNGWAIGPDTTTPDPSSRTARTRRRSTRCSRSRWCRRSSTRTRTACAASGSRS